MDLHTRYRRIYGALKTYGFSPAKAVEIMLDARRGDRYAMSFVLLASGRQLKAVARGRL